MRRPYGVGRRARKPLWSSRWSWQFLAKSAGRLLGLEQVALDNFRKKEVEAKKQLKEERKKLRRDIDSLETRLKWFNIATVPLIVSVSGLGLAFFKRKRTSAK